MKQKIISLCFTAVIISSFALSQTPNRTPQKIKEDNIEAAKFKKDYPELFYNKRIPITLIDGNYYIRGYNELGIRITDNHVIDSVNHNFHLGSTEPGIIPYNNIQVTDEKMSLDLLNAMVFTEMKGTDSALITQIDEASVKKGRIDNRPVFKNGPSLMPPYLGYPYDTITINRFKGDSVEIRISVNGKLLFDWTPLDNFKKNTFKFAQKWPAPANGKEMKPCWLIQYGEGYHITDQNLKINDQLLVEIKDDKSGWMLDRYNFVRVAATPTIASVFPTDNQNKALKKATVTIVEKKISFWNLTQKK